MSQRIEIVSAGTKRDLGRSVGANAILDMNRIAGVVDYRPEELVFTAKAATPLSEIEAMLAARNQMAGFEPADWAPLFGAAAGKQTLAGVVAADVCGPRRVKYGGVRDHVIGCRFINGAGEVIRAGGPVIKNVTGFDIPKLMCGAFGTLGVLTELTFRVLPRPQNAATLVLRDCAPHAGLAALIAAAQLPVEASGLAYCPHDTDSLQRRVHPRGRHNRSRFGKARPPETAVSRPGFYNAGRCGNGSTVPNNWRRIGDRRRWRHLAAVRPTYGCRQSDCARRRGRLVRRLGWRTPLAPDAGHRSIRRKAPRHRRRTRRSRHFVSRLSRSAEHNRRIRT